MIARIAAGLLGFNQPDLRKLFRQVVPPFQDASASFVGMYPTVGLQASFAQAVVWDEVEDDYRTRFACHQDGGAILYYCLNRQQIQRLCFAHDSPRRVTRCRLATWAEANLINRMKSQVYQLQAGIPSSVCYPSERSIELLAEHLDDERLLLTPTQTPQTHHIFHWLAVTETHIALDLVIVRQAVIVVSFRQACLNE